jgi:hypothetical protein
MTESQIANLKFQVSFKFRSPTEAIAEFEHCHEPVQNGDWLPANGIETRDSSRAKGARPPFETGSFEICL